MAPVNLPDVCDAQPRPIGGSRREARLEDAIATSLGLVVHFVTAMQGFPYLDERVHFAASNFVIRWGPINHVYPDASTC